MEKLKKERLEFVDLARGLAVIFMIAVHVLMVYSNNTVKESPFGIIIEFMGGPPAAPVFMFLMGLSFVYSSKRDLKTSVFRGGKIFLTGYILNFFRAVLPIYVFRKFVPELLNDLGVENISFVSLLSIVDILQLAGLSIIILSLIRELNINRYFVLSAAAVISLISPVLWGIKTDQPFLALVLELMWGNNPVGGLVENTVSFPLFPWMVFPLLGYSFGVFLNESTNKERVLLFSLLPGGISFLAGLALIVNNFYYHFNDYYHARIGSMLFMSGFIMIWLYICNFLVRQIKKSPVLKGIYYLSRTVTNIYFIQWIIIMWGICIFKVNKGTADTILIMSVIFTTTLLVNYAIYKFLIKL